MGWGLRHPSLQVQALSIRPHKQLPFWGPGMYTLAVRFTLERTDPDRPWK